MREIWHPISEILLRTYQKARQFHYTKLHFYHSNYTILTSEQVKFIKSTVASQNVFLFRDRKIQTSFFSGNVANNIAIEAQCCPRKNIASARLIYL